jgi:integrase
VQGRCPLPADEDTVLLWATSILATGHKVATAAVRVAAVAFHHRRAGEPSPVGEQIRSMLSGARRTRLEVPRQKRPVSVAQLRRISAKLDTGEPLEVRDRAIFVLGFAGAFRCSELRSLNLEDVEFVADGLLVQLRRSKTDQEGEGRSVAIFRGKHADTCPVVVLERWLTVRGRGPGPLFLPTRGGNRANFTDGRMSRETMAQAMRRGFERAGLDRRLYSGHSLRAGYVTAAAENGATALAIMRQTGHRSAEMVLRYFRPVEAFKKNPLENLL